MMLSWSLRAGKGAAVMTGRAMCQALLPHQHPAPHQPRQPLEGQGGEVRLTRARNQADPT
jgi:hypothetical protein